MRRRGAEHQLLREAGAIILPDSSFPASEVARRYLKEAHDLFADLGYGVLDSAMVETAAYCLEVRA